MLEKKETFIFDDTEKTYVIKLEESKSFFSFFGKKDEEKIDAEEIKKQAIETKPPREGCRAFITDLVVGDEFVKHHISEVYKLDPYSDYVGSGKYNYCREAFPNAAKGTFDGIAVDEGTRIIIYSEPNFEGEKLLDIVGPAIINNNVWKKDKRYNKYMRKRFSRKYQKMFPQRVRHWSKTNMHAWTDGSIIVTCT